LPAELREGKALENDKCHASMKIFLPVVLLVIITILGCDLRYEIVQKNRIGEETAKKWQQLVSRP
jgi:hypothetical protein